MADKEEKDKITVDAYYYGIGMDIIDIGKRIILVSEATDKLERRKLADRLEKNLELFRKRAGVTD